LDQPRISADHLSLSPLVYSSLAEFHNVMLNSNAQSLHYLARATKVACLWADASNLGDASESDSFRYKCWTLIDFLHSIAASSMAAHPHTALPTAITAPLRNECIHDNIAMTVFPGHSTPLENQVHDTSWEGNNGFADTISPEAFVSRLGCYDQSTCAYG
jgi:hypothetical protein